MHKTTMERQWKTGNTLSHAHQQHEYILARLHVLRLKSYKSMISQRGTKHNLVISRSLFPVDMVIDGTEVKHIS